MNGILTIVGKELKSLFLSPTAWLILAAMQFLMAYLFLSALEAYLLLQPKLINLSHPPGITQFIIARFYAPAALIYLLVIPLLSMRLIAEELRQNTLVLLLTAPLNTSQIVLGKFLGILSFVLIMLVINTLMPLALITVTSIDLAAIALAFIGTLLLLSATAGAGLFFSSISKQPVIAAFGLYGLLLLLWLLGNTPSSDETVFFHTLALHKHLNGFLSGTLITADVSYYLLFTLFFLLLSGRQIAQLRGRREEAAGRAHQIRQTMPIVILCTAIAGGGWLSTHYSWQFDLTATQRNTLDKNSLQVLKMLTDKIDITVYTSGQSSARQTVESLIKRYQQLKAEITLSFVDLSQSPDLAAQLNIRASGEMIIRYQGREENLQHISETTVTQAMQRLSRENLRRVIFINGHGERDPNGKANFDFSLFTKHLSRTGFKVETQSLITTARLDSDIAFVVIASPQQSYFPGENALLMDYLNRGGNLLWLMEPGLPSASPALSSELGVQQLPGVIIDKSASLYGINSPDFTLIARYPSHPLTLDLSLISLFPRAAGLSIQPSGDWRSTIFLLTSEESWTETNAAVHPKTGQITGQISFDKNSGEFAGPIPLGIAMNRKRAEAEQRIAILGDGDFLSNAYLGNGGNLALGQRIFNWLAEDDAHILIAPQQAKDINIQLSSLQIAIISGVFFILLPVVLLGLGALIWFRRRRH